QLQEEVAKKFELLMSQTNINPMELMILSNKLSMMSNLAQAARASIMAVKFEVSLYLLRKQTIFGAELSTLLQATKVTEPILYISYTFYSQWICFSIKFFKHESNLDRKINKQNGRLYKHKSLERD